MRRRATMPTDDERRAVARRLRELRGGWSSGECYYTIIHELDLPDTSREDGGHALYGTLADLIESSIPADPGEAGLASVDGFIREMRHSTKEEQNEYSAMLKKMSVELHPVDRDALLKLADKLEMNSEFMEELTNMRMSDCDRSWSKTVAKDFADIATCIREALGE